MRKKILIVRFSSIGDIVLCSPIVRCLSLQLGAEIHFLTKKSYLSIVENNPYLSKVFGIEKSVAELLPALKKEKYDVIIDLHHNLRSRILSLRLGVLTFRFPKLNIEKWLLVKFKINKLPDLHIVDRYFETVRQLGVKNDQQGLDFAIAPEDELDLAPILLGEDKTFYAFAIGATFATKRLPNEKIIAICNTISKNIILLGGKDDQQNAELIVQSSSKNIVNLCGKLSIQQSASVVKQAEKVLTHDTGLMHIAAAFHKKTVVFWGNTLPEFGMYPYQTAHKNIEVKGLACRPCSKIGFQTCPKGHFRCMQDINLDDVAAALEEL